MNKSYSPLPMPVRPENPSPLELLVYEFEKRCAEYHSKERAQKVKLLSSKDQARFIENQSLEWNHLQNLKAALIAYDIVTPSQQELAKYREEVKNKSVFERAKESHHPPKLLAKNLAANGELQPSPRYAPHHIIMGKGQYRQAMMSAARLNLHLHGLGINDPDNGVWLVHKRTDSDLWKVDDSTNDKPRHWAEPDAPVHLPIHTFNYETWIFYQFGPKGIPKDSFMNSLKVVKALLKTGAYPKKLEEKLDREWSGQA